MYQVIEETVDAFPDWLQQVISYASSASFITMLFCILGWVTERRNAQLLSSTPVVEGGR